MSWMRDDYPWISGGYNDGQQHMYPVPPDPGRNDWWTRVALIVAGAGALGLAVYVVVVLLGH